jgi:hypothetical protein
MIFFDKKPIGEAIPWQVPRFNVRSSQKEIMGDFPLGSSP